MSTRGQKVFELLFEAISRGDYPGGSRLSEVDVATTFGVSRTPVRAALSELAAEGLLDYTPNAGYTVRAYSPEDMIGIFETRAALEGLAARQAVEKGLTGDQYSQMRTVIDEAEQMLERPETLGNIGSYWGKANAAFHQPVSEASRNPHLQWLLRKSRTIPLVQITLFSEPDIARIRKAHDEHIYILEAIVNKQAVRAEALAREHIYKAGSYVVSRMREKVHE
jgi:GntR family transcriptional regulator of vanillate catabolism